VVRPTARWVVSAGANALHGSPKQSTKVVDNLVEKDDVDRMSDYLDFLIFAQKLD
jgi:predicted transcriptional regulator